MLILRCQGMAACSKGNEHSLNGSRVHLQRCCCGSSQSRFPSTASRSHPAHDIFADISAHPGRDIEKYIWQSPIGVHCSADFATGVPPCNVALLSAGHQAYVSSLA